MVRCRIKSEGKIIAPSRTAINNRAGSILSDEILDVNLDAGLVISPSVSTGTGSGEFFS
jgi:hypothetical protein